MASPVGSEEYFSALLSRINERGMDAGACEDMALGFLHVSEGCPTPLLLSLLKSYVGYAKSPLYVNEIRNFLRENDRTLYEAYGRSFAGVPGCQEAFGIELPNLPAVWPTVAPPPAPQDERAARSSATKSFSYKKKRRPKNIIRKQAKAAAAAQHRQQVERRAEKKQRRAEFEKLARRENGG